MFKLGIDDITQNRENVDKVIKKTENSLLEMAQIKSDIDCVLLTAGHEGIDATQFPASTFHFICRQMRFSIQECKRIDIEFRENEWRIKQLNSTDKSNFVRKKCLEDGNNPEIEIEKLEQRQRELKYDFYNRASRTIRFVQIHDRLIEINDGNVYTNEQYQLEQPEYYQHFIANKMYVETQSAATRISKGVCEAHNKLVQKPILPDVTKPIDPLIYLIVNAQEDGTTLVDFKVKTDYLNGGESQLVHKIKKIQETKPLTDTDILMIQQNQARAEEHKKSIEES